MEPILEKAEIAELLHAIRTGSIDIDAANDEPSAFLACSPINLFQLTRPDNDQFRIPNFDIILDHFSRIFATSLTNQLQRTCTVSRNSLSSNEFQHFMADKTNPGAIGILDMSPLKHGALIIIDPNLSFSVLEIMLGASLEIASVHLDRLLTTIELNVLKTIITDACNDLNRAFATLLEMHTALIKLENNPRLVSIVEPEAEVIVTTFLIKIGEYSGQIHLAIPFATLEPLREPLKELLNITTKTKSNWHAILCGEMENVPVTVTALSGTISLTINQLLAIQPGDILQLNYDPATPIKVLVAESPKFSAVSGTHNGKKAISLTGVLS
jgi:flagellar motor switch protein FliM